MSSDTEFRWQLAEQGHFGPQAQLKEYERQLAWLPKWVAKTQKEAERHHKLLERRIARLKK